MFMMVLHLGFLSAPVAVYAVIPSAQAQESAVNLAKKLSNPIASLIRVPFQGNYDGDYARTMATVTPLSSPQPTRWPRSASSNVWLHSDRGERS